MFRFQADADLNQVIVAALVRKNPLVDFRTAAVASLEGLRDGEVLALAASDKRILVTHDAKTMPRNFADFVQSHESAGVIVVPQHLPARRRGDGRVAGERTPALARRVARV